MRQLALGEDLEPHAAAEVFPLLEGDAFDELVNDVRLNGLLEPGVEHDGLLLDGRNRQRACRAAGVAFRVVPWDRRGGSPLAFVVSANLRRRQLSKDQLAVVAARVGPLLEAERNATLKQGTRRPEAPLPPRGGNGRRGPTSAALAAAAVGGGVSSRQVDRARAVGRLDPEKQQLVADGALSLAKAERQLRSAEQLEKARNWRPPPGEYSVILADPPWTYDVRADDDTRRGRTPYVTMTTDDIAALKIPAADDCILFCWCTNAFLADGEAARVVRAWGFTPKTIWTWCKLDQSGKPKMVGGVWGRNGTEHLIVATRGKPRGTFESVLGWFTAELPREHSRKPDEIFRRIEQCCPHPAKLEMFARASRPGWTTTGSEADMFDPPALTPPAPEPTEVETSAPPAAKPKARASRGRRPQRRTSGSRRLRPTPTAKDLDL